MIKGVHHIGASVQNVGEAAAFYKNAVDLRPEAQFEIKGSQVADKLLGLDDVMCKGVLINGRTTFLELLQFKSPKPIEQPIKPVNGIGITHVCFQSPETDSAFEKFKQEGMIRISREDPVHLARPDIRYVYGRDVAGLMFETELWTTPLQPFPVWIAHVAFVSADIERLVNFYSKIMLQLDEVREIRRVTGIPALDVVADLDDVDLRFLQIPAGNILLEFWQYLNPPSPEPTVTPSAEQLGYSHVCFEVVDLLGEVARLKSLGVEFLSEPLQSNQRWLIYGRDPDGNLFELIEFLEADAPMSMERLS
ncbi:MAG: VOC family protein [Chloroflexota bacterium]